MKKEIDLELEKESSEGENEPKFISLMSDLVFKTLWSMGSADAKEYLNRITSEIVGFDTRNFSLSTNEIGLNNYKSLANKVDILLVNNEKKITVNIELNRRYSEALIRKNDTYLYKIAGNTYRRETDSKTKNEKYEYDINVCQININGFNHRENSKVYMDSYKLCDVKNNYIKEGIKFYNLYLPKIKELCYDSDEELYKDLAMFMAESYEEMESIAKGDKVRVAIMEELKKLGSDEEFVDLYDHDEFLEIYKKDILKQTKEEGRAEGIVQGIEQGEQNKMREIAKRMLNLNKSIEEIVEITGLSQKEIEKLQ